MYIRELYFSEDNYLTTGNITGWYNAGKDINRLVERIIKANEYQGDTEAITEWLREFFGDTNHESCRGVIRTLAEHEILGVCVQLGDKKF